MSSDFRNVKKILVIKLLQIGDVLLSVPVFRALKEHFTGSYVAALVNSGTEDMLSNNPFIDDIIVFDRKLKRKDLLSRYYGELSFLGKVRSKGFDMVVDLTSGDRAAIIAFASGARYRIAYRPYRKGFPLKRHLYTHLAMRTRDCHTVLKNLEIVRQFGICTQDTSVNYFVDEKSRSFAAKLLRESNIALNDRVIHMHPLSRLFYKCWKDEYMAEVISWLIDQNAKLIITSSPDRREVERIRTILSHLDSVKSPLLNSSNILNLSGKTTLKELAAISEASSLFFGVDSAPMHLAAAVGTPVIALFGDAQERWRPWGDNHTVISRLSGPRNGKTKQKYIEDNMQMIKPEDVIIELKKRLS